MKDINSLCFKMPQEKLIFIDAPTPPPTPKLKFKFKSCRPLWQEIYQSDDSGYYSADDEMESDYIKGEVLSAQIISKTLRLTCTSQNGACGECKLSREIEKAYQSESSKCSQQ